MLVWVRKLMASWAARAIFALLIVMFVFWGISNVFTLTGSPSAVATVNGQAVDISVVQAGYQRALSQYQQQGQQPDAATRQQLALQALSTAIRREILRQAARQYHIGVPDAAVRTLLDSIPVFQTNGVFDKAKFEQVLQQNGLSPDEFIGEMKDELIVRQLITPVIEGAAAPPALLDPIFALLGQQRSAAIVNIPAQAEPAPPPPSDAVLERYWRNHQSQFTSPEYRKVQVVILSPALLAPQEKVAPDAVEAGVAQAMAQAGPGAPVRSAEVLAVQDLADASQLKAAWKKGASWAQMQALAQKYHATPVPLDKVRQNEIPTPSLAQAIFSAAPGEVVGPVAGESAMYLFKVTGTGESGPDRQLLAAQVTRQLQLQQAEADVAKTVDAVQDALAGQTPLDQLPGNLGLVAVEGTLDAQGRTPAGTPAPVPGGDKLKAAIVQAAFSAAKGQAPQLQSGPDGSYFAVAVKDVIPPGVIPFAQARGQVLAAWTAAQQQRAAQAAAANLMQAVNTGTPLDKAAAAAGLSVTQLPGITSGAQPPGLPAQFVPVLFSLKPGQASMLETGGGYTVLVLTGIHEPSAKDNPDAYAQLQQTLNKSLQDDLAGSFLAGLQAQDKVTVNQKLLSQLYR